MKCLYAIGLSFCLAGFAFGGGVAPSFQASVVSSNSSYTWTNTAQPVVLTSAFLSPGAVASVTCTLAVIQGTAINQLDSSASATANYKWSCAGDPIPVDTGDKVRVTLATGTAVVTNTLTLNFRTQ